MNSQRRRITANISIYFLVVMRIASKSVNAFLCRLQYSRHEASSFFLPQKTTWRTIRRVVVTPQLRGRCQLMTKKGRILNTTVSHRTIHQKFSARLLPVQTYGLTHHSGRKSTTKAVAEVGKHTGSGTRCRFPIWSGILGKKNRSP